MGFDPVVRTETFGGSDKSWIRTRDGLDNMLPGMLDMSLFAANHVVNGRIPSGTALGKVTSSGLFGPYAGRANEVQRIAVDATGGNFTITVRGQTTAAIAFNASAAAVQAAIELLDEVNVGDIVVTGGPGNAGGTTPYVLTFSGDQFRGSNPAAVTTGVGSLTGGAGTAAVTTPTGGGAGASDGTEKFYGFLFEDAPVRSGPVGAPITPDVSTAADTAVAVFWDGVVIESKLPVFTGVTSGMIDANGKRDQPNLWFV